MIRNFTPGFEFFPSSDPRVKKSTDPEHWMQGPISPRYYLSFLFSVVAELQNTLITKSYGHVPYIRTRNYSMNLESIYVWLTPGRTLSALLVLILDACNK
jgi:hypothetical protein